MRFEGLSDADMSNVYALNNEFLSTLRRNPHAFGFRESDLNRFSSLSARQMGWLAESPFLLYSITSTNAGEWAQALTDNKSADLFDDRGHTPDLNFLALASAAFLWQLVQQNPYAVRLITGVSTAWCELLTDVSCVRLLSAVRLHANLFAPRKARTTDIWHKLLHSGVSVERETRRAAQISALQVLVTSPPATDTWSIAACASHTPELRVADSLRDRFDE